MISISQVQIDLHTGPVHMALGLNKKLMYPFGVGCQPTVVYISRLLGVQ